MAEIDTILDNQKVTADILKDIAIDLGYTSFNGFGENKFGADELNGITSALVSSGILSSGDKCEPYISGDKVYIKTGTIVFSNGAKKKITQENGEDLALDLIPNTHIYALNDTVLNTCKIIVSETAPSEGDFVMIAEISANGSLVDKRTIAKAWVELPSEGNSYVYEETITEDTYDSYEGKTLTLPIGGISKIFIQVDGNTVSNTRFASMYEYDVSTQVFNGFYCKNVNGNPPEYSEKADASEAYLFVYTSGSGSSVKIKMSEQTNEHITFSFDKSNSNYPKEHEFKIKLYAFGGVER